VRPLVVVVLDEDVEELLVSEGRRRPPFAAIAHRSLCEDEPAHDRDACQDRGNRVTKKYGCGDGTSEGGEIRHDVVDGGNKSPVHDMGDSYEDTTREGDGQEEAHHGRSLAEAAQDQSPTTVALA
jgi:hypothetical protein